LRMDFLKILFASGIFKDKIIFH